MNIYASYACNANCAFCSLHDRPGKRIALDWLEQQLEKHEDLCEDINILGGEPSVLPLDYQERLVDICTKAAGEKPYYITNLLNVSPVLGKTRPIVSYDFGLREDNVQTMNNILQLDMPYSLSTILTDELISRGSKKLLRFVDMQPNCERIDLVMYRSGTTEKDFTPDHEELMKFVSEVMDHPKINLTPYSAMKGWTDNSFANVAGRFGFLPDNKYGVRIDYGQQGYTPFDSYDDALIYYIKRINEINRTKLCGSCPYKGRCWCVGGYENEVCHGDREMMELFERRLKDVHPHV
jgi:hypothetical protein